MHLSFSIHLSVWLPSIELGWWTGWWYMAIYLIVNNGLFLVIPPYAAQRFSFIPQKDKLHNIRIILYIAAIVLSTLSPLSTNLILLTAGTSTFIIGLLLFITALFQFAITPPNRLVNKGIYRKIKHPVYLSTTLILTGTGISTTSFYIIMMAWILYFLMFRAMKSEEVWCDKQY